MVICPQAKLHNGLAAANMKMGNWEEAEHDLQTALNQDPNDADTLANLIACSLHLGKSSSRYLAQLKMQSPPSSFMLQRATLEEAFDRASAAAS